MFKSNIINDINISLHNILKNTHDYKLLKELLIDYYKKDIFIKYKEKQIIKPKETKLLINCNHFISSTEIIKLDSISPKNFNGFTPNQIKTAYNIPTVIPIKSKNTPNITIIIAYHYPHLQRDFNIFCTEFCLPSKTINIINLTGSNDNSSTQNGWDTEVCLDVQIAYSINPNANIVVIEAKSNSLEDLLDAINYANGLPNTHIVSMSWGCDEFLGETNYDNYFNKNICYTVSSGDTNLPSFPAVLSGVVAVGGTTLTLNPKNIRKSEYTWTEAGCGYSNYISKPSYQNKINKKNYRCIPDVSLVGNPFTGVQIYCNGCWYIVGGTSVSNPIFAGIISLSNCDRLNKGKKILNSSNYTLQNYMYQTLNNNLIYNKDFFDITKGKDGSYSAGIGFDEATGLGVPNGINFVNDLLNL